MIRLTLISFLALGTLAGCGLQASLPTPATTSLREAAAITVKPANELRFNTISVGDLTTSWDDPGNNGKLVAFEGSFGPETYAVAYMVTNHGYKLWDHSGHGIRVRNIYTQTRPGQGPEGTVRDRSRDFSDATRPRLLSYGNFVNVEGSYVAGYGDSSHSGSFRVPPTIDVWFINGKPTSDYVSK